MEISTKIGGPQTTPLGGIFSTNLRGWKFPPKRFGGMNHQPYHKWWNGPDTRVEITTIYSAFHASVERSTTSPVSTFRVNSVIPILFPNLLVIRNG